MSSPQLENGYTRIANELLDAIIRHDFSKREYQVLLAIIRKTYGYQKKADELGGSQLAEMTGLHRQHVVSTVAALVKKKVLVKSSGKFASNIGINKNYNEWTDTKTVSVAVTPKQCQGDTKTVSEVTPKQCHEWHQNSVTQKKTPKENPKRNTLPPPLLQDLNSVAADKNQNRGGGEKILGTDNGAQPETGERGARGKQMIVQAQDLSLIFPAELTAPEREAAQNMLKSCNGCAQDIVDTLAAAMVAGQVKKSAIAFLGGLVRRYEQGTFDAGPGMHMRLARQKHQTTDGRQAAAIQASRAQALREFEAFKARQKKQT